MEHWAKMVNALTLCNALTLSCRIYKKIYTIVLQSLSTFSQEEQGAENTIVH